MAIQVAGFTDDQTFPFWYLRKLMAGVTSAGSAAPGDLAVSPSSGLQVQISSGLGFVAQTVNVEGGSAYNGLYMLLNDGAASPYNTISAPVSNPRIDQVILRVYDVREQGLSGSSFGRLEWLEGAEDASASLVTMGPGLSNPGAATLPANSLQLAYVLQTVGESSIPSGNILNVVPLAGRQGYGTLAQRPLVAYEGAMYYATDTSQLFYSNGTTWNEVVLSPGSYDYRKLLLQGTSAALAGSTAGDYILISGGSIVASGGQSGIGSAPIWVGDSGLSSQPTDFQVPNKVAYGRVRVMLNPNATSAGINMTFGLYQITGTGGTSANMSFTFGSALSGSTVTLPAAGSLDSGESGQFALPTSGYWALGVNLSGTMPSSSVVGFTAQLYGYNA